MLVRKREFWFCQEAVHEHDELSHDGVRAAAGLRPHASAMRHRRPVIAARSHLWPHRSGERPCNCGQLESRPDNLMGCWDTLSVRFPDRRLVRLWNHPSGWLVVTLGTSRLPLVLCEFSAGWAALGQRFELFSRARDPSSKRAQDLQCARISPRPTQGGRPPALREPILRRLSLDGRGTG